MIFLKDSYSFNCCQILMVMTMAAANNNSKTVKDLSFKLPF